MLIENCSDDLFFITKISSPDVLNSFQECCRRGMLPAYSLKTMEVIKCIEYSYFFKHNGSRNNYEVRFATSFLDAELNHTFSSCVTGGKINPKTWAVHEPGNGANDEACAGLCLEKGFVGMFDSPCQSMLHGNVICQTRKQQRTPTSTLHLLENSTNTSPNVSIAVVKNVIEAQPRPALLLINLTRKQQLTTKLTLRSTLENSTIASTSPNISIVVMTNPVTSSILQSFKNNKTMFITQTVVPNTSKTRLVVPKLILFSNVTIKTITKVILSKTVKPILLSSNAVTSSVKQTIKMTTSSLKKMSALSTSKLTTTTKQYFQRDLSKILDSIIQFKKERSLRSMTRN